MNNEGKEKPRKGMEWVCFKVNGKIERKKIYVEVSENGDIGIGIEDGKVSYMIPNLPGAKGGAHKIAI